MLRVVLVVTLDVLRLLFDLNFSRRDEADFTLCLWRMSLKKDRDKGASKAVFHVALVLIETTDGVLFDFFTWFWLKHYMKRRKRAVWFLIFF